MADAVTIHQENDSPPPLPRGMSRKSVIDEANEKVTLLDFAAHLASEQGKKLMGRGKERFTSCLIPGHEDSSPSFYFNPQRNVWYCHGCQIGGDVVRLAQLAWGYSVEESHVAAAELLWRFGHEIPPRPESWYRKQERQKPIRDAIDRARFEHLRRRLFRRFFKASVLTIEDEAEREAEYHVLWDATEPLAEMLIRDLVERRSA